MTQKLNRISYAAALALIALTPAACTIPLRGDASQTKIVEPGSTSPDRVTANLAECRSVTYEQKDALAECRKAWAEKRRQFPGQGARPPSDSRAPRAGSSLFVAPKDESRVPSGFPPIQQNGKD